MDMISMINSDPRSSWKAKPYKKWEGKTLEELREYLGTTLTVPETVRFPRYSARPRVSIPKQFDLRDAYPSCVSLHEVRDQQHCGSCWAFSGAEVLSDRFCIATNGTFNEHLSPEHMVQCDQSNYGCDGGYLDRLWKFLAKDGTVTDECKSYKSGGGHVPKCAQQCDDGSPLKLYKADPNTITLYSRYNLEAVQEDIMRYGSVQIGFKVYQDFFSYSSGVYQHKKGGLAGGHAVKIIGWGVDSVSGLPYWTVVNSWGYDWGMKGLFWILRGSNECDLESQMYAARPQL